MKKQECRLTTSYALQPAVTHAVNYQVAIAPESSSSTDVRAKWQQTELIKPGTRPPLRNTEIIIKLTSGAMQRSCTLR